MRVIARMNIGGPPGASVPMYGLDLFDQRLPTGLAELGETGHLGLRAPDVTHDAGHRPHGHLSPARTRPVTATRRMSARVRDRLVDAGARVRDELVAALSRRPGRPSGVVRRRRGRVVSEVAGVHASTAEEHGRQAARENEGVR
ncbi:hypothetical protein GCM10027176_32820 [Actinoallomurus bryophytorum]|uniref:Uncharacterized protein n=2 Tax=Actinoallomurus bryophytorum TaxID=1490222 RepID=A0A543BTT3_9ACTN|nr:hypothetical protein FB559_8847 [Actinoallomurus bryophytorum]